MFGRIFVIFLLIEFKLCFSFQCKEDGSEIKFSLACDGKRNCLHGSDESFMLCKNLYTSPFACAYGAEILHHMECNDVIDCADESDEHANCDIHNATIRGHCEEDEFQCYSGACRKLSEMCDGKIDCEDGRDESANLCMEVGVPGMYQCANGVHISQSKCCDNNFDCIDGSDEIPAICKGNQKWNGNAPKVCVEPKNRGLRFAGSTLYHKNLTHQFVEPNQPAQFECYDRSAKMNGSNWGVCLRTGEWRLNTICSVKKPNRNPDTNGMHGCVIDKYDDNLIIMKCNGSNCDTEVRPPINNMLVQFSCKGRTTLSPIELKNRQLFCNNKKWVSKATDEDIECIKLCNGNQLFCYDMLIPHCFYPSHNAIRCGNWMPAGTVVTFGCKIGTQKSPNPLTVQCQEDGTWSDRSALRDYCTETCGKAEKNYTFISKDAREIAPRLSPWTVPIYIWNNTIFERKCIGTRIRRNLVLTAAHCVYSKDNGMLHISNIRVGKSQMQQTLLQKDNDLDLVQSITCHSGYTTDPIGADLAIIKLQRSNISDVPMVICLPWIFNTNYSESTQFGKELVSWETTNAHSAKLTIALGDIVPRNTNISTDLFKVEIKQNSKICAGDSGGGFIDYCPRTYSKQNSSFSCLYGVVSHAKHGLDLNKCSDTIEVTNIAYHIDFINKEIELSMDECDTY